MRVNGLRNLVANTRLGTVSWPHQKLMRRLTLSDPMSNLVRHYDFPILLRCRVTSDNFFFFLRLFARSAVGACPTLFLM